MKLLHTLPLLVMAALALTSCKDAPRLSNFMPISFADSSPIELNIYDINFQNEYQQTKRAPHIEHMLPVPLDKTIENWTRDRIKTVGSDNSLLVVVKEASMVERQLPTTKGFMDWFKDEQAKEYTAKVTLELRIYGDRALSLASTEITATRSRTVPESASLAQRDEELYRLTKALMNDLNAELEKNIQQYFSKYIRYSN